MTTQYRDDAAASTSTTTPRRGSRAAAPDNSLRNAILAATGVLVLLLLALFGLPKLLDKGAFGGNLDEGGYQAVILSNDKVYFGKLKDVSGDFYQLEDAYFARDVAPAQEGGNVQRQVLPVSNELHTPENSMMIRKDDVVIVENLSEDSEVLKAIKEAESK